MLYKWIGIESPANLGAVDKRREQAPSVLELLRGTTFISPAYPLDL